MSCTEYRHREKADVIHQIMNVARVHITVHIVDKVCLSSTAESVSDRHMKRNDVALLNLPFQKTAKVKLFPMMPTTTSSPTITVYMVNM